MSNRQGSALRAVDLEPPAFKIEKGVPIPQRFKAQNFPLARMHIGDSFVIPCTTPKERQRAVGAVKHQAKKQTDASGRAPGGNLDGLSGAPSSPNPCQH